MELWDGDAAQLLGKCCASLHPLLSEERSPAIDAALPLATAGGLIVGMVRLLVDVI